MELVTKVLPYIQIVLSILLVTVVLLQQSAAGLGNALGGTDSGVTFHTRRGFEKFLFVSTFVLGILFIIAALAAILI